MRLVILDNYNFVSEWAAKYVRNKILAANPGPDKYFVLGLPTGSTPVGMYKKLIEFHKTGELSFKSKNAHLLDGNAEDLEGECKSYEEKIAAAGGVDLFIGGIGPDGHIAFNEPGSSLASRTRIKTLAKETIVANARFFGGKISDVPTQALTVGVATVMEAREVMILITGVHKAFALHKAIEDGVNHMWTVSAFQQHPQTIFVCDEDATMELKVKTVKYFKGLMDLHNKLVEEPGNPASPVKNAPETFNV